MTELEQAAADLRQAIADHSIAEAELVGHEENIDRLQSLSEDMRIRRDTAALAVRHAREKLFLVAAPKETPTP